MTTESTPGPAPAPTRAGRPDARERPAETRLEYRTLGGIAHLNVDFGTPQPFTLRYHFWENNLATGDTTSGGARYGAHAVKR